MGLFDGGGSSNAAFGFGKDFSDSWEPIGGSYTEPDFKIDWHGGDAYKNSPFGSASEEFMYGANNPGIFSGVTGQSPSFSDKFGKNFLDAYKSQKMGAGSGSTGKTSVGVTPGSAGGHQVTGLGDKSRTKLIQYINPTAQVIPGGPGTPGRPGLGEQIAGAAATAAIGSIFCDVRLKTDIEPLKESEVNDALADVAFFVKEIRECA